MRAGQRRFLRWLFCVLPVLAAGCGQPAATTPGREQERRRMVDGQILERGVNNERVLEAMRRVPRHEFVPEHLRGRAYEDSPLPIGEGQTISQPYIVAYMTEAIDPKPGQRVLEVGTGS